MIGLIAADGGIVMFVDSDAVGEVLDLVLFLGADQSCRPTPPADARRKRDRGGRCGRPRKDAP